MKTALDDRILFYDGTCQIPSEKVVDLIIGGVPIEQIAVLEHDDEVGQYNQLANTPMKFGDFGIDFVPDFTWQIPNSVKALDLATALAKLLRNKFENCLNFHVYEERLQIELKEIKDRNLSNMVKTLFFVIDYFRQNDIVYGVGRGSSCASLILFLIGVHCIDPVKFEISHLEFFHE